MGGVGSAAAPAVSQTGALHGPKPGLRLERHPQSGATSGPQASPQPEFRGKVLIDTGLSGSGGTSALPLFDRPADGAAYWDAGPEGVASTKAEAQNGGAGQSPANGLDLCLHIRARGSQLDAEARVGSSTAGPEVQARASAPASMPAARVIIPP